MLENYVITAKSLIYFAFQAPPTLNPELRNRSVELNSMLTLTCIVRGDVPLQINWTRNGGDLGNDNTYIVDHMTFNHTGLYGCMANNSAGKTQIFFWIDVTGKVSNY